jgi:pilus assembly protein CpaF
VSFEVIIPFLRPIQPLLESKTICEIMVNPDSSVWIEQDGQIRPMSEISFDEGALQTGLEVIANRFGKKLDADSPILNLRLPDGSRLAAMISPLVHPRPLMTIRKFTSRNFTMADLVAAGMLTLEQAATLTEAVQEGQNILIAGATSTGKTTLLNVLADAIPDHERILLIEDTAELHIRKPHIVSAESQTDTHRTPVNFDDLLKAALRHRPDRIVVGEVRGPEAQTLLDAMNTGHRGTLATIHAGSTSAALHRLATLAIRNVGAGSYERALADLYQALDITAFLARINGIRAVHEVVRLESAGHGQRA